MRYFIGNKKIENKIMIIDDYKHIVITLRKKINDEINILINKNIYQCKIEKKNNDNLVCKIIKKINKKNKIEKYKINIILSIFKFKQLKSTIDKIVQIGINKIYLVKTERSSLVFGEDNIKKKIDKLKKIICVAIKQSNNIKHPKIKYVSNIKKLKLSGYKILFNESEKEKSIYNNFKIKKYKTINFFVGPEGGFTEEEILLLIKMGFKSYIINETILKCETAAVFGYAIILTLLRKKCL